MKTWGFKRKRQSFSACPEAAGEAFIQLSYTSCQVQNTTIRAYSTQSHNPAPFLCVFLLHKLHPKPPHPSTDGVLDVSGAVPLNTIPQLGGVTGHSCAFHPFWPPPHLQHLLVKALSMQELEKQLCSVQAPFPPTPSDKSSPLLLHTRLSIMRL